MGPINPAEGERRAAAGYEPQYRVAAELTLAQMRELEWVRVADPAAGIADDFQIATSDRRLHALQVKWNTFADTFTFGDLKNPSQDSLIAGLASAWTRLRGGHPDRDITIHLVSNAVPSSNDSVPEAPGPGHFAAFLARSYRPARQMLRSSGLSSPNEIADMQRVAEWQEAWDVLRDRSGLSHDEFWLFVRDFEINLGIGEATFPALRRRRAANEHDIDRLANYLFRIVADPGHEVQIERNRLLVDLGWTNSITARNPHVFPVPAAYTPNNDCVTALMRGIDATEDGYLAVVAPAGMGKSTLLEATDFPARRLVRYYAYVPDAPDPSTGRGESENFFLDVVSGLDAQGLHTVPLLDPRDRLGNKELLLQQFEQAASSWQDSGERTIVIVDGLDHIPREQRPARSLIDDLPLPSQIPAGVLIILGSQRVDILPRPVQRQLLDDSHRIIELDPLTDIAILAIADSAGPGQWLPRDVRSRLVSASEGHPLALTYLLQELNSLVEGLPDTREADLVQAAELIIDNAGRYGGEIERRYDGYWQAIAEHSEMRELLGIVARLRSAIELAWLRTFTESSIVDQFAQETQPFFHREGNRWSFVHNSFRLFLAERTASHAGSFEDAEDRRLYSAAADLCAQATGEWSVYAFEEIGLRALAGQHQRVLELAQPNVLRAKLGKLAPLGSVRLESQLALRSAVEMGDSIAILRIGLFLFELDQREAVFPPDDLARALADNGLVGLLPEHVLEGRSLRVGPETAFDLAGVLLASDRRTEAGAIARAAGSLEYLIGNAPPYGSTDVTDAVEAWAELHTRLRGPIPVLEEVEAAIPFEAADSTEDRVEQDRGQARVNHRLRCLQQIALTAARDFDLAGSLAAIELLSGMSRDWAAGVSLSVARVAASYEPSESLQMVTAAIESYSRPADDGGLDEMPHDLRVAAAYLLLPREGITDRVVELASPGPDVDERQPVSADGANRRIMTAYRLHRLRHIVGCGDPASTAVESAAGSDAERRIMTAFFEVAELDASIWRGRLSGTSESWPVMPTVRNVHSAFETPGDGHRSWPFLSAHGPLSGSFFRTLISVAASADPTCANDLAELLFRAWNNPDRAARWPHQTRMAIVTELASVGADPRRLEIELAAIEEAICLDDDIAGHERVESFVTLARSYRALDNESGVERCLKQAVEYSLFPGFNDEDYQLDHLVELFASIATNLEAGEARSEVIELAARLDVARSVGYRSDGAARALLEISWQIDSPLAVDLAHHFEEAGTVAGADGLAGFLRGPAADSGVPADLVAHAVAELYLPTCMPALPGIAADLLTRGGTEIARILGDGAALWALPTERSAWSEAIEIPVPESVVAIIEPDTQPSSNNPESPNGGSRDWGAADEDVEQISLDHIGSVENLLAHLRTLEPAARWGETPSIRDQIARIAGNAGRSQLVSLGDELVRITAHPEDVVWIVNRLVSIGDGENVDRLISATLRYLPLQGWVSWWDKGLRRQFWQGLITPDHPEMVERAKADLATALSVGALTHTGFMNELAEILNVIGAAVQEAWPTMSAYLAALCSRRDHEVVWAPDTRSETQLESFLRYVGSFLGHPVRALDWGARFIVGEGLIGGSTSQATTALLLDKCRSTRMEAEAALSVMGRSSLRPDGGPGLEEVLCDLSASSDQIVRDLATAIANSLGITPDGPDSIRLPAVYGIELPPLPPLPPRRTPMINDEGVAVHDPMDPSTRIVPYDVLLAGHVASLSGIEGSTLVQIALSKVEGLADSDPWTRGGVSEHATRIKNRGWLHSYRPWALSVGRRAAAQVVAELVDSGAMPYDGPASASVELGLTDPIGDRLRASRIPVDISRPARRNDTLYRERDWVADTVSAAVLYESAGQDPELIVVAEYIDWFVLDWGRPRERRVAALRPREGSSQESAVHLQPGAIGQIESLMPLTSLDTLSQHNIAALGRASEPPSHLAIRGQQWFAETAFGEWLALSPALGTYLGWSLSREHPLMWLDQNGEPAAMTIRWVHGLVSHKPPRRDDDVGEGWRVCVTPSALIQIEQVIGPLDRYSSVARAPKDGEPWGIETLTIKHL